MDPSRPISEKEDMRSSGRSRCSFIWVGFSSLFFWAATGNVLAQSDWKQDWQKTVQEAKKEGTTVAGIPARAELRKQLEPVFKSKFGIDMEFLTARGPQN